VKSSPAARKPARSVHTHGPQLRQLCCRLYESPAPELDLYVQAKPVLLASRPARLSFDGNLSSRSKRRRVRLPRMPNAFDLSSPKKITIGEVWHFLSLLKPQCRRRLWSVLSAAPELILDVESIATHNTSTHWKFGVSPTCFPVDSGKNRRPSTWWARCELHNPSLVVNCRGEE